MNLTQVIWAFPSLPQLTLIRWLIWTNLRVMAHRNTSAYFDTYFACVWFILLIWRFISALIIFAHRLLGRRLQYQMDKTRIWREHVRAGENKEPGCFELVIHLSIEFHQMTQLNNTHTRSLMKSLRWTTFNAHSASRSICVVFLTIGSIRANEKSRFLQKELRGSVLWS